MRGNVIFDLDGTLTQSEEGIWKGVRYACRKMHLPDPSEDVLRSFIGPPPFDSFHRLFGLEGKDVEEAVRLYREYYRAGGKYENRVYPGIRRMLRTLRRAGYVLSVATGKPEKLTLDILEHFGLLDMFERVAGPGDDARNPGKKALILRAMVEDAGPVWMVGDRRFDMEGAREAQVHGLGVLWGYGSREELEEAGAEFLAENPGQILEHLCPEIECSEGFFLSMEGLDGSGKGTQMKMLLERLDRCGYDVTVSREPGGCPISEKIRALILDPANLEMDAVTEAYLYAASRAQHVRQVILPALRSGRVMVSDRYLDSSVAYQGGGRQLGVDEVMEINRYAIDQVLPDLTVFLDLPRETALNRRYQASVPDRLEMEDMPFHARVDDAYRELIMRQPERFFCVDARGKAEEVAERVWAGVRERLKEWEYG